MFRHTFRYELTVWQVLSFGEGTSLPVGSSLRVRSLTDGAVQNFDGISIADYHLQSSGMNGDAVEIELVAGPNTRGISGQINRAQWTNFSVSRDAGIGLNFDNRRIKNVDTFAL